MFTFLSFLVSHIKHKLIELLVKLGLKKLGIDDKAKMFVKYGSKVPLRRVKSKEMDYSIELKDYIKNLGLENSDKMVIREHLREKIIEAKRLKDLNREAYFRGLLNSL